MTESTAAATGCASCSTPSSTRSTRRWTTWPAAPTPRRSTSAASSRRRRRAAGGDAAAGDARAGRLAAAAGHLGHRRRVRRGLRVGRGVQPRVRPGLRPPAERDRRQRDGHWLPAPNGIHFHPPTSLWVHTDGATDEPTHRPARRATTSTTPATCSTVAKQLPDEDYRATRLPGDAVLGWDGPDESLADVLTHLVFTKEVWLAAIDGEDFPPARRRRPGRAARAARGRRRRAGWRRCATSTGAARWEDRLVDALCDPPESFVLSSVVAHVLTYAAHRRQLARQIAARGRARGRRRRPDQLAAHADGRGRRNDPHDLLHRHHARRLHRRRARLAGLAVHPGPGRGAARSLRGVHRRTSARS